MASERGIDHGLNAAASAPRSTASGSAAAEDAAMRVALAEARAALAHGDVPIGAVALQGERIVAQRHNERERLGDPTAHAELLVLRDTAALLGRWRLDDITLVVTLEPCIMCAGGLLNARIAKLVYGAADPKGGATATLYNVSDDPRLNHRFDVRHGVLAADSSALLQEFFGERR